jgi:C4-dicarboxylate-specific signal transduction histidine kinase
VSCDAEYLDEVRSAVQRVVADADRASDVIRRIRELARKTDSQKVWLNLNEVIDDAVLLVRREVQSHQVPPQLDLAPDLPPVCADRVQLQQVIINLLINAIQAMASVTDRSRAPLISARTQGADRVLVAVRDSGIGIDAEIQSRLFDTFFATKADGVGMGPSICRSIIEAHGGEYGLPAIPALEPPFNSPRAQSSRSDPKPAGWPTLSLTDPSSLALARSGVLTCRSTMASVSSKS